MNVYRVLSLSGGVTTSTITVATDITQAVFSAGVGVYDVIKIELVGSHNEVARL